MIVKRRIKPFVVVTATLTSFFFRRRFAKDGVQHSPYHDLESLCQILFDLFFIRLFDSVLMQI